MQCAGEGGIPFFAKAVRQGLEHYRFHALWHTFAANSLLIDVKPLQASLGFYSDAFTLDHYGHVVKATQDEIRPDTDCIDKVNLNRSDTGNDGDRASIKSCLGISPK